MPAALISDQISRKIEIIIATLFNCGDRTFCFAWVDLEIATKGRTLDFLFTFIAFNVCNFNFKLVSSFSQAFFLT